jgi:hypothetical protein
VRVVVEGLLNPVFERERGFVLIIHLVFIYRKNRGTIMRRIIVILVVVVVGGYFVYDYFQGKAKEKTEEIARTEAYKKKRESIRVTVTQMVTKHNAASDWEDKLRKGSGTERKKILTMDLENLWLTNKPILFKGRIKDISTLDDSNYLMTLNGLSRFSTKLTLTLKTPKNMIDSFLNVHPKVSSGISTVAVIAKINKIETKYRKTEEGDEEEIRTGVGQCIDILLYSELFLEDLLEERTMRNE